RQKSRHVFLHGARVGEPLPRRVAKLCVEIILRLVGELRERCSLCLRLLSWSLRPDRATDRRLAGAGGDGAWWNDRRRCSSSSSSCGRRWRRSCSRSRGRSASSRCRRCDWCGWRWWSCWRRRCAEAGVDARDQRPVDRRDDLLVVANDSELAACILLDFLRLRKRLIEQDLRALLILQRPLLVADRRLPVERIECCRPGALVLVDILIGRHLAHLHHAMTRRRLDRLIGN